MWSDSFFPESKKRGVHTLATENCHSIYVDIASAFFFGIDIV